VRMQRSGGLWGDTRTAPAGLPWDWHRVPAQPVAASWAPRTAAEARPELRSGAAGPPPPRQLAGARSAPDPGDGGQPYRAPLAATAAVADDQRGSRARGRAVRFEDAPAELSGGREGDSSQAWADAGGEDAAQAPASSPYQRAPASASGASPAAAGARRAGTGQAREERKAPNCPAASAGGAALGGPGGGAAGLDGWLASVAALSRGGAGQYPDPVTGSPGPLPLAPDSPFAAAPGSCASSETRTSDAAGSAASAPSAEAAPTNGSARYGPGGWPGGGTLGYPGSDLRPGGRHADPFDEPPGGSRCRPG